MKYSFDKSYAYILLVFGAVFSPLLCQAELFIYHIKQVFLLIWLHFFFAIWFYSLDFAIWFLQSDLISAAKTFSWDTIKSDISRLEKMLRKQGQNYK